MGKHSEWRKLAKKLRRKRIRQKLAKARYEQEENARRERENSPSYPKWLEEQQRAEEFQAQEEARLAAKREAEWLRVEKEAQRQWVELQKKLQLAREEKAKQREKIRQEWELEEKKLKAAKEEKERLEEEKRKQQEVIREKIERFVEEGGEIPEELRSNFETNPGKANCLFFQKTGACRFREACSRNHVRPGISRVLLIPNFYTHYSLEQSETEHGDSSLEFEYSERYEHFKDFFYDVLPELEKSGYVRQFKVCCNHEAHLRGNVYVEFRSSREAIKCYRSLQGRWYGGKQLQVEFCGVNSWMSAICGLYFKRRCPKGSSCNFLHVFKNPLNLFHKADRDEHRTPPNVNSELTPDTRNWRWSESPEKDDRTKIKSNGHTSERRKERHRRETERSSRSSRSWSRDSERSSRNDERSSRRKRESERSIARMSSERKRTKVIESFE